MNKNELTPLWKDENRKILHELLDLILDTNGLGHRQKSRTDTMPTIFARYSGHVSMVHVELYTDGWDVGEDNDREECSCPGARGWREAQAAEQDALAAAAKAFRTEPAMMAVAAVLGAQENEWRKK